MKMTDNKIKFIVATSIVGLAVVAEVATSIYKKVQEKKNNKTSNEEVNNDTNTVEETVEDVETAEEVDDTAEIVKETTNISSETDEDVYNEEVIDDDSDETCGVIMNETTCFITDRFRNYLINSDINEEEVEAIIEPIELINIKYPEKMIDIESEIEDMMKSDFDINRSQKFNNHVFLTFYGSIDPRELFTENRAKLILMGAKNFNDLMQLASSLNKLKKNKIDEFSEIMYQIYHHIDDIKLSDINENTYNEFFKEIVNKYVVPKNIKKETRKNTVKVQDFREVVIEKEVD